MWEVFTGEGVKFCGRPAWMAGPLLKTLLNTFKNIGTWSLVAWKRAPNHLSVRQSVGHLRNATTKIGSLTTVTSVLVLLANRFVFYLFNLDIGCGHCC